MQERVVASSMRKNKLPTLNVYPPTPIQHSDVSLVNSLLMFDLMMWLMLPIQFFLIKIGPSLVQEFYHELSNDTR